MTLESRDRDLIQAEIDGTAGEAERAALRERSAADPAVAEELREMRRLAETLKRVEPITPPADLAEGILRAMRPAPAGKARGLVARLWDALPGGSTVFPYAYAVAVGAAACFLLLQGLGWGIPAGGGIRTAEAAGTMAGTGADAFGRIDLSPAGVRGTAVLRADGGRFAVDLTIEEGEKSAVGLRFDPAAVAVVGISAPGSRLDRVDVLGGSVSFMRPSDGRVTVLLARRGSLPSEISVGVVEPGGELRRAGVLEVPAEP